MEHIDELRLMIGKIICKIRIDFMQKVVVSTKPESMLFNELIVTTKENINSCYKKLMLYFHTDKWYDKWYEDENEALVKNVAQIIITLKEAFLESVDIDKNEEIGNERWQKSQDVKFAINKHWDKIKSLNKVYLENLSEEELKALRNNFINESYQYYKE